VLLLGFVLALAWSAATASATPPCAAETRLVNAWLEILNQHVRITGQQTRLLGNMYALVAADQDVPGTMVTQMALLTGKNTLVISGGERRLARMPGGTPNGRRFKGLALRYLREVARPLNSCIGRLIVAQTRTQIASVIQCVESVQRTQASLSRAVDRSLAQMAATTSPCR